MCLRERNNPSSQSTLNYPTSTRRRHFKLHTTITSNPLQDDAIPQEPPPLGVAGDGEADGVDARPEDVRVDPVLQEPPLAADLARAVQRRVARQAVLVQRAVDVPVDVDVERAALRVPGQGDAQQRRPVGGDVARGEAELDCPLAERRLREVPVRVLGLPDGEGQVRRALRRHAVLVRDAAVPEAAGLLVELADLEDALALGGDAPRELAQVERLVLGDGDGRGEVGVHVAELAAVGRRVDGVGAAAHPVEGEAALVVGVGGVVVVPALDRRADGRVGVAEEDCGARGRAAIGQRQGPLHPAARVVGCVLEPGVGDVLVLLLALPRGVRDVSVVLGSRLLVDGDEPELRRAAISSSHQIPEPRPPDLALRLGDLLPNPKVRSILDNVELNSIAGLGLPVDLETRVRKHAPTQETTREDHPAHRQSLAQVVAVVVLCRGVDVPGPGLGPVDAVKVAVPDGVGPVVLGDEGAVGQLPGLVLDVGRARVQREVGQGLVLEMGAAVGEEVGRQPPQGPQDADVGQGAVDEILVRAGQVVKDDPVEVAGSGGEADVDVVRSPGRDGGVGEPEVVLSVCARIVSSVFLI